MRKADTAARKARSTRNRHNGRVNHDTKMLILSKGVQRFTDSKGQEYFAQLKEFLVPNALDPLNPYKGVKSRIVKVPAAEAI